MKYNQKLPKEVEQQLDDYIDRVKKIQWFKVSPDIKREDIDKNVYIALEGFGVKASIEYRSLKTARDWDDAWDDELDDAWKAALDDAFGDARGASRGAAWDAARDAAWNAALGATRCAASGDAWNAARGAASDTALGAIDLLSMNIDTYKKKYPNGNFINIIPLWEAGLFPYGVIDGKFVLYVPEKDREIPQLTTT